MPSRRDRSRGQRRDKKARSLDKKPQIHRGLELEPLEPRILLTTLVGGDVFEYIDASGQTIRVALSGDMIAEFIAGDVDDNNDLILGDIPGTWLESETGRAGEDILGGRGGEQGVIPVTLDFTGGAPTSIVDPDFPAFNLFASLLDDNGEININSLASQGERGDGTTYGFNVGSVTFADEDRLLVQLLIMDTPDADEDGDNSGQAYVEANLQQATLREDATALSDLLGPTNAFTADPTQFGVGYAINTAGELYSVSLLDGTVNLIGVVEDGGGNPLTDIGAMAVNEDGELYALSQQAGGGDTQLIRINKNTGGIEFSDDILETGTPVNFAYTGMTFDEDGTILASTLVGDDNENTVLQRITIDDFNAEVVAQTIQQYDGWQIQGLSFSEDIDGERVVVGLDHTDDAGVRMVELDFGGGVAVLNTPGMISNTTSLSSAVIGDDDRPILYSTNGTTLFRGSNISLPVDADGVPLTTAINGADFRPHTGSEDDGRLYFVIHDDDDAHRLYSIEADADLRSQIQASLRSHGLVHPPDVEGEITSLAWDQTGSGTAELWGFLSAGFTPANTGAMVQIDPATGNIIQAVPVFEQAAAVTDIRGIEFIHDDPETDEEFAYAVRGADVIRIDMSDGSVFVLGPTPDPQDDIGDVRGENLQGLAWNSQIISPFTGEFGVLIATDTASEELVFVDHRHRPQADVFAIYVSQASADSSITMAVVPEFDPADPLAERPMMPFDGSSGSMRVLPTGGGDTIIIGAPGGTGGVYIGAKTEDIFPDFVGEELIPIIAGQFEDLDLDSFGTRPGGVDDLPDDDENPLSAGVRVVESLLEFINTDPDFAERMMGMNLDSIVAMGISSDGTVAVIDDDQVDPGGNQLDGFELALIDASSGQAEASWVLIDAATGLPLSGVAGIDYGDINFDGNDELFGILEAFDLIPQVNLGDLVPDGGTGVEDFRAIAVSEDGETLYGVALNSDDEYELYEIERDQSGDITDTTLLGVIVDALGNAIIDIEAIDMDDTGTLMVAGWNVDAPAPNASLGRLMPSGEILLSDINDGDGVPSIDPLGPDLRIFRTDGSVFDVNLAGATQLQDVLDAINEAVGNEQQATISINGTPQDGDRIGIDDGTNLVYFEFDDDGDGDFPSGGGDDSTVRVEISEDNAVTAQRLLDEIEASVLAITGAVNAEEIALTHGTVGLPNGVALIDNNATNVTHEEFFAVRARFNQGGDAIVLEYRDGGSEVFAVNDLSGAGVELGLAGQDVDDDGVFVGESLGISAVAAFDIRDLVLDPSDESTAYAVDFNGAVYDLYTLLRDAEGGVDSFMLEGQITADGEVVLGIRGIDADSNGDFYFIGVTPDQLNPDQQLSSNLGGGGLDSSFDIVDVISDPDFEHLYFLDHDDAGVVVDGRTYTNFLNLATINDGVIDSVTSGTVVGDQFGNDLAILSATGDGDDIYSVAFNSTAPLPNANVGGDLGDVFNARGTAVDQDGAAFTISYNATDQNYNLVQIEQDADNSVTGNLDLGTLEFGGDQLRNIQGMVADVNTPGTLYVVATLGLAGSSQYELFQIDVSGGAVDSVTSVQGLNSALSAGRLWGLAQDPNNTDHFYMVRHDGTNSHLMRADTNAGTFEYATGDAATSTVAAGAVVSSLAFNGRGDLVGIQGEVETAGRHLIVVDRAATSDFTAGVDADTYQASEVGSVGSELRDLAVDLNSGRFFAINNVTVEVAEDEFEERSQLWTSASELWRFDTNVVDPVTVAESYGTITLDDGTAVFGDAIAVAMDDDGQVYTVFRTDTDGDGTTDTDLLHAFTLPPVVGSSQIDATALGEVAYDGTSAEVVSMTYTAGGELVAIDESGGVGNRVLVAVNTNDATQSVQLTDPGTVTVDDNAQGLTTDGSGRVITISTDGANNSEVLVSGNQQRLFSFDSSFTVSGGAIDVGSGTALVDDASDPYRSSIDALAINDDDRIFAVAQDNSVPYLVEVETSGQVSVVGNVSLFGSLTPQIAAMEFTANGDLVAFDDSQGTARRMIAVSIDDATATLVAGGGVSAVDGSLRGLAADSDGRFLSINTSGASDEVWISGNQLFGITPGIDPGSPARAQLRATLSEEGLAVLETAEALAVDPETGLIRMVVHVGGQSVLLSADPATGDTVREGAIRVDGNETLVTAMDYADGGALVAIDETGEWLITINVDNPLSSEPSTQPGAVDAGLVGLAIDGDNFSYAIQTDTALNQVWQSPGVSWVFGSIELGSEALFHTVSFIDPSIVSEVETMAIHPSSGSAGGVYLVGIHAQTQERMLFKMDPFTGDVDVIGSVDRQIGSMDFDQRGGALRLMGHDVFHGRLVDIGYNAVSGGAVPVGEVVSTSVGSFRATLGAIAFDPSQNRFLGADNATSHMRLSNEGSSPESALLMRLAGVESDSANPQHINRAFFGGTVTGRIETAGSMEMLYAGWLPIGHTPGLLTAAANAVEDPNFVVEGDLRNLVVNSTVGSIAPGDPRAPEYLSGFSMLVGGKVGQILTINDFFGEIEIENDPDAPGLLAANRLPGEVEGRLLNQLLSSVSTPTGVGPDNEGDLFENFLLWHPDGRFNNDTFDTAQRLGATPSAIVGEDDPISVLGSLMDDDDPVDQVDYYAASLLAGQTITVQLFHDATPDAPLHVGIFDPDGRLVATDYDRHTVNAPFQFTADRPGEYRFAIGWSGDVNFNGALDDGESIASFASQTPYLLQIEDAGNLALGGLVTDRTTLLGIGLHAERGDLGAVYTANNLSSIGSLGLATSDGNLRSMSAGVIGIDTLNEYLGGKPWIQIAGHVGLLETRDGPLRLPSVVVDGNVQVIDAAVTLTTVAQIGGGIGVIRADSMLDSPGGPSQIVINAFGGSNNVIGLIDIAGDLIGAEFITNDGGDVRYMRVGGAAVAPGDIGELTQIHDPGQSYRFVDGSGAEVLLTPTTLGDEPTDINGNPVNDHVLTTRVYPLISSVAGVNASGGEVLIDVTSTGGILAEVVNSPSGVSNVYLGTLIANGEGRAVEVDEDDGDFDQADGDTDLVVALVNGTSGDVRLNAFGIEGGDFTRISNNTRGEIVNVAANSVWELRSHGSIGVPAWVNDTRLVGHAGNSTFAEGGTYPFIQQTTGIDIVGDAYLITSDAEIGNIRVGGSAWAMLANADFSALQGHHDGINAPIYVQGDVERINIGHGIQWSGSGDVRWSGIFVDGALERVHNAQQPAGSDIRGAINAVGGIGTVHLRDASIIDTAIHATTLHEDTRDFVSLFTMPGAGGTFESPNYTIDRVQVTGDGGIIGSRIRAANIDTVNVDGFGIISSVITGSDGGRVNNVTAGGLGIHDTVIDGGTSIGDVRATGDGELLDLLEFASTVRPSEDNVFDPRSGKLLSSGIDLHVFFGTSADESSIEDLTIAGMLRDITITGNRTLDSLSGYRMEASVSDVPNIVRFGGRIGTISTVDTLSDLHLTAGRLDRFQPGSHVNNATLNVDGPMNNFHVKGNFGGNSVLHLMGADAGLRNFTVDGDMDGELIVNGIVNRITIGGDLDGSIIITPPDETARYALNMFTLGGTMSNGSFNVGGNVGTIRVDGSLGIAGDELLIEGDLNRLEVGRSRSTTGSQMAMDVTVLGDLRSVMVDGAILGDLIVGGDLSSLQVSDDTGMGGAALVAGLVQVGGSMNRFSVTGGNVTSEMRVTGDISRIDLRNGNITSDARISSVMGDIRSISIRDGDLLGDVRAVNGSIDRIQVSGSDLGGLIEADALGQLRLDGDVLSTANVQIVGELGRVDVGGDVESGATLVAGALGNANIRGSFAGEMESGYYSRSTRISIGENFAGMITSNGSDTRFDVRGDFGYDSDGMVSPAELLIGRDLSSLRVNGDTVGQITVNGAARMMQFQGDLGDSDSDTVVTTAFSLDNFRVSGDMDRTLLQVGTGAGRDLQFGTDDTRELTRMAELGRFDANSVSNSVIAAGGEIGNLRINDGLTDSSVSAGMVVSHDAIANLLGGGLALTSDADRNTLRTGVDLYRGSMSNVQVNGSGVVNSFITAGVDPIDGDFTTANTLLTTETGGQSNIRSLNLASIDGNSAIVTDSGVDRQNIGTDGGALIDEVTYDIADVAPDLDPADLSDTVSQNNPVTLNVGGETVTIDLRGSGEVDVYVVGGEIDTLVLRGTDSRTNLTIEASTPDTVTIDRIIAEDDATVGRFDMTGINLGSTGDPSLVDFWLDGEVNQLTFHAMADDASWTGRIGGDVRSLDMHTQGSGGFVIGGEVNSLTIADSSGVSLLGTLSDVPVGPGDLSASVQTLAINEFGLGYVFDEALGLVQVDPDNGAVSDGPHPVVDAYADQLLAINGMDFNDALLLGVTDAHSVQPVVNVGSLAGGHVSLVSLAVDSSGSEDVIYAVENSGYYEIGEFDTAFDEIVATAWIDDGSFYMVNLNDADTPGDTTDDFYELLGVARAADGTIQQTTLLGTITSGGENVLDVGGLEYNHSAEELVLIGREESASMQSVFTIELGSAMATEVAPIDVFAEGDRTLNVTPTLSGQTLTDAFLAPLGMGVNVTNVTVDGQVSGSSLSAGTFTNPGQIYGISDGIVISTGDVADYGDGADTGNTTTTYGPSASAAQQMLLQQVTGGAFSHFDVTEVTFEFDLDAGFDSLFFDMVWGTEELGEREGTSFVDALGVFVNGTNIAEVGGQPINVNHPEFNGNIDGTELDGVLAPSGDPLLRFDVDSSLLNQTGNELTIIVADTSDTQLDSTVYLSGLSATQQPAGSGLTDTVRGMAFGPSPDNDSRVLYLVTEDSGSGGTRLLRMDGAADGAAWGATDLGLVEIEGDATSIRGITFDPEGRLIGQNTDAMGRSHRVLIDASDPTQSQLFSRPDADPENIYGLGSEAEGERVLGVSNGDDGVTRLYGFNAIADRLVEIDPETGARIIVGEFVNSFADPYFNNVEHIAAGPDGEIYAALNDRDGSGTAYSLASGAALGEVDLSTAGDGFVLVGNPDSTAANSLPALLDGDDGDVSHQPVTDRFGGLAVGSSGSVYAVLKSDSLGDVLVQIGLESTDGQVAVDPIDTNFGNAQTTVEGDPTDIIGIGFDGGQLFALNRTSDGTEIIAEDAAYEFVRTSVPGLLASSLTGFGVGGGGESGPVTYAYDLTAGAGGGTFYASAGAAPALGVDYVPRNIIGSSVGGANGDYLPYAGFGDVFDIRSITTLPGDSYGVLDYDETLEAYRVFTVSRTGLNGEVRDVETPQVLEEEGTGTALQNVHAIVDQGGSSYVVATVGSDQTRRLFDVDLSTGEASEVDVVDDGRPVRDDIVALSRSSDNAYLIAVRETDRDGQELLRINRVTGETTSLGFLEVAGAQTNIHSLTLGDNNELIAVEAGDTGSRVLRIDTSDPTASEALTARGALNANLRGYTWDTDQYVSVYSDGQVNSQLWGTSPTDRAVVLGTIDTADGSFMQMLPLLDGDGHLLTSSVIDVTVDEDNDRLFSVTADGRVFEHDATTGRFVQEYGRVFSDTGDGQLRITRIEFNPDTGQLLAVDGRFNQLVELQLSGAEDQDGDGRLDFLPASPLGESGSINAGRLADFAYDPANGRLSGVTASPDARFAEFLDSVDTTIGGLYANSFSRVDITTPDSDGEFDGRLVARGGEGIRSVRMSGDFTGAIVSAGEIGRFDLAGDFGGTLQAWNDINSVNISGDVLSGSTLFTSGEMRSFRVSDRDPVSFAGTLTAQSVGRGDVGGDLLSDGLMDVEGNLSRLSVSGAFDGEIRAGSMNNLDIRGNFGSGGVVAVDGDVRSVRLSEGTGSTSMLYVGGTLDRLSVDGTHQGTIASKFGIGNARLGDVDRGLVAAGTNLDNIQVNHLHNAVLTAGVWIGEDMTYNTADDVIFGGAFTRSVMVRGDMVSSVVAAGVLPTMDSQAAVGTPNLPHNTRAYSGFELTRPGRPTTFVDSAEAGGMLPSGIGRFSVNGNVTSSGSATVDGVSIGRQNVVVAAGDIDDLRGNDAFKLVTRSYHDVYGAPSVESFRFVDGNTAEFTFSEEINTASLSLAQDNNGDGILTGNGSGDHLGTVIVTDSDGRIINDVDLDYSVQTDSNGDSYGVLRVIRQDGDVGPDDTDFYISLGEDGAGEVYDRSGGRSLLRNPAFESGHTLESAFGGNGGTTYGLDPYGTILDGNNDGTEGGSFSGVAGSAASSFVEALTSAAVMESLESGENLQTSVVSNLFQSDEDIHVYRFTANAYDFFSVDFTTDTFASMGVFVQDDQGTPTDLSDDTFELLTRYDNNFGLESLFHAYELPSMEAAVGSDPDLLDIDGDLTADADGRQEHDLQFFVVVAPLFVSSSANNAYTLDLTMSSTDDMLDGQLNGQLNLPNDSEVAYISNELADTTDPNEDRGNLLGYNDPRQLVYLDFDGGTTTGWDGSSLGSDTFDIAAFEAADLDPVFSGISNALDLLLNGGSYDGRSITGILDQVLEGYGDTSDSHTFGKLNVEFLTDQADLSSYNASGASGLFFTTTDPEEWGFTAQQDFSTVLVGAPVNTDLPAGLLGVANQIGWANMDPGIDVMVNAPAMGNLAPSANVGDRFNDYSTVVANIINHELGHALGLNHHGSMTLDNQTIPDSPTNDPGLEDDSFDGISTMGSGPTSTFAELWEPWRFGTARVTFNEFPIGHADHVDQLLRWLGQYS